MNLLTIALTLAASAPGELPDAAARYSSQRPAPLPARLLNPLPVAHSPYGQLNLPVATRALPRPAAASPYGIIRYDQPAIVKPIPPAQHPRMLPAIPVSRPPTRPAAPRPVILPPEGLIPPPMPSIPLSPFGMAINYDRPNRIRLIECAADWLLIPVLPIKTGS